MDITNCILLGLSYTILCAMVIFCGVFTKINCSLVGKKNKEITQHDFFRKTLGGKSGIALLIATVSVFLFSAISIVSSLVKYNTPSVGETFVSLIELLGLEALVVSSVLLFVGEKTNKNKLKMVSMILGLVSFALIIVSYTIQLVVTIIQNVQYSFDVEGVLFLGADICRWAFLLPAFILFATKFKNILSFAKGESESLKLPRFIFVGALIAIIAFTAYEFSFYVEVFADNYSLASESEIGPFVLNYLAIIFRSFSRLCAYIAVPIVYHTLVKGSYCAIKSEGSVVKNNIPVKEVEPKNTIDSKPIVNEVKKEPVVASVTPVIQPGQSSWQPLVQKENFLYDAYGNVVTKFKERRSLFLNIILSDLTLFILPLVTGSKMIKELNACRTAHGGDRSRGFAGMMLFFSWLTFGIAPLIWGHRVTRRYSDELKYRGIDYNVGTWRYWVLFILLSETIICPIIYLHKIFKASRLINAHHNKFGDHMVTYDKYVPIEEAVKSKPVVEETPVVNEPVVEAKEPISEPQKQSEKPKDSNEKPMDSTSTPQPQNSKGSVEERLAKAKKMLADGIIEESEYKEIRANILKDL